MNQHFVYPLDNELMHDSAKRLLDCARAATRDSSEPIATFNDLGKRLPASSAMMTNWKKRGVSKLGAIKAERLWGCSVQWILEGTGAAGPAATLEARESGAAYPRAPALKLTAQEVQLINMFRVLSQADAREVVGDVHQRAARALGDKLLAERFGVKGYATDARVGETYKAAPQVAPAPGDRRQAEIPVDHDRRKT